MASAYEVGTMFGGFTLGFISDRFYRKRSPVGAVAIIISFIISISITIRY
jgi:MFS family permease